MKLTRIALAICLVVAASTLASHAQVKAVSSDEAKSWARYTVPLPKSMEMSGKVTVPLNSISIVLPSSDHMVIGQAHKELRETLALPSTKPANPAFTITMQLGGAEADKLKSLNNFDQAYSIAPTADNKGLRLTALTPVGLYYAAKTLQQLAKPRVTQTSVEMPLLTVTDWPDLEDRGTWGSNNYDFLRWFGDRKLNIVEQISGRGVSPDGRGHSSLKGGREPMITEGPLYGIRAVPAVLHLEQVTGCGALDVYPNLKAIGENARGWCYSQPRIVDIIADWIVDLASLPNVYGVDVWMAENLQGRGGCQCAECKKTDRNLLEARVIFAAWRQAEKRLGRDIILYILTSEETVKSNDAILKEMPDGVRFWYYQWLTYNTSSTPMVKPYLEAAARRGQWIGVVPNLDSMTHFLEPFTGAEFIHYRMNEFVDKGMKGLLGYVTPLVHFNLYNLEAAAEWSWNAKGRTPQEFALSYAIREGIKNPEKWAEWAGLVGPVEWMIYGSEWPSGAQRGIPDPVAKSLLEGKLPRLGTVLWDCFWIPFGDIKSEKQLNDAVASAAKALEMSKQMGVPEYYYESLVADGYIKSLKALWELRSLVKNGQVAPKDKDNAERYFKMYLDGLKQTADALPKWEATKDQNRNRKFTDKAVGVISKLRTEMIDTASKLGFTFKL